MRRGSSLLWACFHGGSSVLCIPQFAGIRTDSSTERLRSPGSGAHFEFHR